MKKIEEYTYTEIAEHCAGMKISNFWVISKIPSTNPLLVQLSTATEYNPTRKGSGGWELTGLRTYAGEENTKALEECLDKAFKGPKSETKLQPRLALIT